MKCNGEDTQARFVHFFAQPILDAACLKPSDRDVQSESQAGGVNRAGGALATVQAPQAFVGGH